MKTRKTITVETIEHFTAMKAKGFNATDVARITHFGKSTVQFYFHALEAIHAGEPVPNHHHNVDVMKAYCQKHGLRYIAPQEPEAQPAEEQTQIPECAESVKDRFIRNWPKTAEANAKLAEAIGVPVSDAIARFVFTMIGEYLKNGGTI